MNDEELRDLLPLAALDALDADELREFENAIESRPDLRAELDELRRAVAQLAGDEAAPPARLKQSILDEIAVTDQAGPDPAAPAPPANVVPLRRRWVSALAVAAAAVAVLVGAIVWINVDSSPDEEAKARDVLEQPDATTVPLTGELEGVRIVYSPSSDDAALVATDMPTLPQDRTYQLWSIRDDVPASAGVFVPDDDGDVLLLVDDFRPDAVMAITDEPEGGSEQPTSTPLVASS